MNSNILRIFWNRCFNINSITFQTFKFKTSGLNSRYFYWLEVILVQVPPNALTRIVLRHWSTAWSKNYVEVNFIEGRFPAREFFKND